MIDRAKKMMSDLSAKGVPIPLARDHDVGSVNLTLVLISFFNAMYAINMAKSSESMMYAVGLFSICGSMYFGKKWQMRKIGSIDLSGGTDSDVQEDLRK